MVQDAVGEVRRHWTGKAHVALVLGTGLGNLTDQVHVDTVIPFDTLPHFPRATALSHRGVLVCGRLHKQPVMLLDGRCHLYEGYSLDEVTLPIRVMHACGASVFIVSNASGGLNPHFASGDVMVIDDHINLMGNPGSSTSPRALPLDRVGYRNGYDAALNRRALEIARTQDFAAHQGVYVAVNGPNYETRAEYRFMRRIGGDAVGMSTAPEVDIAAELNMRVLGLSAVTNIAQPDTRRHVDPMQVVKAAEDAAPKIGTIVAGILASL
jgi:purine-nucleoside phosphorylase